MSLFRKYRKEILIAAAVLLFAGFWIFFWHRISGSMRSAQSDAALSGFTFSGAHYTRLTDSELTAYTDAPADAALCGEKLGTVPVQTADDTVICDLFACKDMPREIAAPAVLLAYDGLYLPYELSGFTALDQAPSAAAVCAAYGITGAESIRSVEITEADGTPVDTMTEKDDLQAFYEKLAALGDDIGAEGQMQAYLDVYRAAYPDDDRVQLVDGVLQYADDESEQQAMQLWADGACLVTIRLTNGLQLRNLLYAPVPALFAVYGIYRLNTPFFQ